MEQNIEKEFSYICGNCEIIVPLESKDYHEQYLCERIIRARKAEQQANQQKSQIRKTNKNNIPKTTNQALKQQQELQQSGNIIQTKIPKNNQQNDMDFISQLIPFIKKTNSDLYQDLNQEQKKDQSVLKHQEKPINQGQTKPIKKYEEKKPQLSRILSQSQKEQRRSKINELIKKKSSKHQNPSLKSRIPVNKSHLAAPAPRRAQSLIRDNKVQCTSCQQLFPLQIIDDHEYNCGLIVDCEFCGLPLQFKDIEGHQKKCEIKQLWEDEQKMAGYLMGEYGDGNDYVGYRQEFSQYDDFKYQNYQDDDYQLEQQPDYWGKQSKKHKGLSTSKLASLSFSSYRKQKNSPNSHQQQKHQKPEEQPCAICYLAFEQNQTIIRLPCLHTYHPECVGKWFQGDDRCPMCKKKL